MKKITTIIIGTSGSGRSTILEELQRRGFEVYGIDEMVLPTGLNSFGNPSLKMKVSF